MQQAKNLKGLLAVLLLAILSTPSCRAVSRATTCENDGSNETSSISATNNMTAPRSGHTATLLPDGRVLITGGMERNGAFYSSVELYDPATGKFTLAPKSMNMKRVGHTAVRLPNNKVLIAGGWGESGVLASAELYDPATGEFTPTGSMSTGRGDFTATLLPNGRVLVAGGENGKALESAEIYDPASGNFTPTGEMREGRTMHTAVLLPNGKVLIAGGGDYRHPLATAELYDPQSGTFTLTGSMSVPRYKHGALLLPDRTVLVVGGSDGRDWQGRYASAEIYNPAKGTFSAVGNMNTARFKVTEAVALLKNGQVLIAGGGEQVEIYDPGTRTFRTATGRMDAARFYSTATLLADGRVLVTGGYDDHSLASARAWIYRI